MTEKKKLGRPRKNEPKKRTQIVPFRDKDGWLWRTGEGTKIGENGKPYKVKYTAIKMYVFCPETDSLRSLKICGHCELRSKRKSKKGVVCWSQSTTKPPQYYNRFNNEEYDTEQKPINTATGGTIKPRKSVCKKTGGKNRAGCKSRQDS